MSTSVLERPTTDRPANGGLPSRRAIFRWSWRTVRRDWRQELLVLGLLSFSIGVLICGTTFVYNLPPDPAGSYGTAERFVYFDARDRVIAEDRLSAARRHFGTIEVIGFRYEEIPGSIEQISIRAQDPSGGFGAPMLAVVEGRFPTAADEIAITDHISARLGLDVGDTHRIDGLKRRVVGFVENPGDLESEFVLVAPDHADPPQEVTVLFNGDAAAVRAFVEESFVGGFVPQWPERPNDKPLAATLALSLGIVFLVFACLMASAGFAVLAQRRLRQSGMLAAIGASQKHVRLALAANGTVTAVLASLIGLPFGFVLWSIASPLAETAAAGAAAHRVERFGLPWHIVAAGIMLSIAAATIAAWWPGRVLSLVSVAAALSARRPHPRSARRPTLLGVACAAIGVGCLIASDKTRTAFIILGPLFLVAAVVLIAPVAIRIVGRVAGRLPLTARVAVRDLARYQARSSAALAAISLALTIVMTVVVGSTIAGAGAGAGNLPADQIRVYGGASRSGGPPQGAIGGSKSGTSIGSAAPPAIGEAVRHIAAAVDGTVTTLYHAGDPAARVEGPSGKPIDPFIGIGQRTHDGIRGFLEVHIADAELLKLYGVDPDVVPDAADVIGPAEFIDDPGEDYEFIGTAKRMPVRHQMVDLPTHSSLPTMLITEDAMRRQGWQREEGGWLITSPRDLTDEDARQAIDAAARYGLEIETPTPSVYGPVRAGALAAGAVLAFAILAMTVGLIRAEAMSDLRTLTAAGASRSVRRRISATTSAVLTLCGVVIGTIGAYAFMAAWLHAELDKLGDVPWIYLLVALVGLPLAAAAGGWLFAGRQPSAIVRRAIE